MPKKQQQIFKTGYPGELSGITAGRDNALGPNRGGNPRNASAIKS